MKTDKRAFTLIELVITVIIIGVIAGFGMPSYTKARDRARERDALSNLELIREAVRIYIAREDDSPPVLANIGDINTTLYLSVLGQEGNTYNCDRSNIYRCFADNTDGWQLRFRLNRNDGAVDCSIGPCPTL